MSNLGKKAKTSRGFSRIDFEDIYGDKCSLQESSLDGAAIWLGQEHERRHPITNELLGARMHLDRKKVQALIKHLQHWLKTGGL